MLGPILLSLLLGAQGAAPAGQVRSRPVLHVDVPAPTKDKPQSKLWYEGGTWWAWLPRKDGSSVWRRTAAGWVRQHEFDEKLRGLPGQADVWSRSGRTCAVLSGGVRLAVACLRWMPQRGEYEWLAPPVLVESGAGEAASIETATIAADGRGRLWIAYGRGRHMWVRTGIAERGSQWSDAIRVSEQPASGDDICAIASTPAGVLVMWSDQEHDAVYARRHENGKPAAEWQAVETVDAGGKTADDHISLAVSFGGIVYAATKNSRDTVGVPQLVLRIGGRDGRWSNHPYAMRTNDGEPSRPIVLLDQTQNRLHLLHTVYGRGPGRSAESVIVWQSTPAGRVELNSEAQVLIEADTRINDVTSMKSPPQDGVPWLVLASDAEGNVYEASIRTRR